MKNFLKYFIPIIIVAISFIASTEEPYSAKTEKSNVISTDLISDYTNFYELDSDSYLPRQSLAPVTSIRQNYSNKRVNNNHRNNFALIKEGKAISHRFDTLILKSSFTHQPSFTNSFQKLISFGKLII